METADKHPQLHAVCQDAPDVLTAGLRTAPELCRLTPLHLAAAMGRERCLRALLKLGSDPSPWTAPPPTPAPSPDAAAAPAPNIAEEGGLDYVSYESVCASTVYKELKLLLPSSSNFPHTFALAQLLLRAPCTPLVLAVRFGRQPAAHILLSALLDQHRAQQRQREQHSPRHHHGQLADSAQPAAEGKQQQDGQLGAAPKGGVAPGAASAEAANSLLRCELDAALTAWSSSAEPQVALLGRLLGAGADPLPSAVSSILQRYNGCSLNTPLAEKMRAGLEAILSHLLPAEDLAREDPDWEDAMGASSSDAASGGGSYSDVDSDVDAASDIDAASDSGSDSEGIEWWTPGSPVASTTGSEAGSSSVFSSGQRQSCILDGLKGSTEHLRTLLSAAVVCRDAYRCDWLLAALEFPGLDAPWAANPATNATLLVCAAAHDMPAVVTRLLALPPVVPGGATPPFSPNMWGEDGLSALMAAANRGAVGALQALVGAGANVSLADELGATALHWAVVGNREEAVLLLAQHGAAVDQTATVHEEEEHLERPLLTATHGGNLSMMRLLCQLGASLETPTPSGYTPLSVAVCWEQKDAARLLLELGADPNQVIPPHINAGFYQLWSENYSIDESRTLLGMACSRLDWREFVELLFEFGADPALRHPQTGLTPGAEAASIGALEEAALVFQLCAQPAGPWTLEQLGWAEATAQAARNFYFYSSTRFTDDTSMEPLLDVWRARQQWQQQEQQQQQQQGGSEAPPAAAAPDAEACRTIVEGLLSHAVLTLRDGGTELPGGAELAGVLQAERLASVGVFADLVEERLQDSPCKVVVLAAAPPAARWAPARHKHFPRAFKQAVRQLLLANHVLRQDAAARERGKQGRVARAAWPSCRTLPLVAGMGSPAGGFSLGGFGTVAAAGRPAEDAAARRARIVAEVENGMFDVLFGGRPGGGMGSPAGPRTPGTEGSVDAEEGDACSASSSSGSTPSAPLGGLPTDAVCEVIRHLASFPLSFWMRQPSAPPASASVATPAAASPPAAESSPAAAAGLHDAAGGGLLA